MTKQFTFEQLFSLLDGRLSTGMDDVYAMLNHICDYELMTHQLPVALDYLREKSPKWFQEQKHGLKTIARTHFRAPIGSTTNFTLKDIPFEELIAIIQEKYNETVDVPQLKDEVDTSDFGDYMIKNSLLLKKIRQ